MLSLNPALSMRLGVVLLTSHKSEMWGFDGHSHSWLSLKELLAVDYDETFEDRRVTKTYGNITYGAA